MQRVQTYKIYENLDKSYRHMKYFIKGKYLTKVQRRIVKDVKYYHMYEKQRMADNIPLYAEYKDIKILLRNGWTEFDIVERHDINVWGNPYYIEYNAKKKGYLETLKRMDDVITLCEALKKNPKIQFRL